MLRQAAVKLELKRAKLLNTISQVSVSRLGGDEAAAAGTGSAATEAGDDKAGKRRKSEKVGCPIGAKPVRLLLLRE